MKFTPAPWTVHNTGDVFTGLGAQNAEGIEAPSNDGWHIADCDMGGLCLEEVRANAHLIAAAPMMADYIKARADDGDIEAKKIWEVATNAKG